MSNKKSRETGKNWLRSVDLNHRPSGYEPDELPGCSTPRQRSAIIAIYIIMSIKK